jgi:hypothetical protein
VIPIRLSALAPLVLLLVACGGDEPPAPERPSPHLLAADLLDAIPVLEARKRETGADVAVFGRVSDVAKGTITLVDDVYDYCGRGESTHDTCATPWDYCCEVRDLAEGTIVVKAQTADGKPVPKDQLGVRPLDLVAVQGTLEKDAKGDWSLVARHGWFRRERPVVGPHVKFTD